MIQRLMACVCGMLFGVIPVAAQTAAGLDQFQLDATIGGAIHSTNAVGQTFTVGTDGILSGIEVSIQAFGMPTTPLVVEVRDMSGGAPGTLIDDSVTLWPENLGPNPLTLVEQHITATLVPLQHLGISLSVGDKIGVLFTSARDIPGSYGIRYTGSDPYPDGNMFGLINIYDLTDTAFKTFVAVPVFDDGFESGDTAVWSASVP